MRDKEEFYEILGGLSGKDESEYQQIIGDFDFSRYIVRITQVEARPDAPPTQFLVRVPQSVAVFPPHLFNTPVRRTALEDYLTRTMAARIEALARFDSNGVARRRLSIAEPGQKILPRSAVSINDETVEARLYLHFLMPEGNLSGTGAQDLFFEELPTLVNDTLIACNLDGPAVNGFIDLMEDADQVRQVLPTRGWVGFAGVGAFTPREGKLDTPSAKPAPNISMGEALQERMELANHPTVVGIGVPQGITVILGDAYSGRSELIRAMAHGIYNHIPGDGREWIITVPDAVYVAADSRRSVQHVDISAFVKQPIRGMSPSQYSTDCADACTAQAAATVEALEVGARVLLFDESDSSPAFLTSDSRLPAHGAPRVIPLVSRARQIVDDLGVSLVVGGDGSVSEFIPIADTVFRMVDHHLEDITVEAKAWAIAPPEVDEDTSALLPLVEKSRWVVPSSLDASKGRYDWVIHAMDAKRLAFGRLEVCLDGIEQLAELDQTETIGLILQYAKTRYLAEGRPVREILDLVDRDLSTEGLECLTQDLQGRLARPRRYEIAAVLNRISTLRISHVAE